MARNKARSKPPKPFRKPLKPKKYRKNIEKRIYLEPDRQFLSEITTTDEAGRIVLARELTKEELGRLKKLRKEARKNRGAVRTGRLVILAVIAGAVLVFNVLFRDRLVEEGAESLLEGIFLARADLNGVTFRPFAGEISFDTLTIADEQAPMQNLVELSSGAVRIDTWQLLNRRVLIQDLAVEGLQFGTPRESSGALEPGAGPRETGAAEEERAEGGLRDRIAGALPGISFADLGLPDTLDAQAFLEANLDALQTPGAVDAVAGQATVFVDRWQAELTNLTADVTDAAAEIQAFARTDFAGIRSVDAALVAYSDATDLQARITGLSRRVESRYTALVAEATGILDAARAIPGQVTADYNDLSGRIPDVRTEGREFIVGLVEPYVRQALGSWYERILRGYGIYQRITAEQQERPPRPGRDPGVDIDFARTAYPRFLLADGRLGVGASGAETVAVRLRNVTSDPDIVDAPTLVEYAGAGRAGRLAVNAVLDGRESAAAPLDLRVVTSDTPLAVNRGLEGLGLSSVTGALDAAAALTRRSGGGFDGALELVASGISVAGDYAPNSIGEFVADLLSDAQALEAAFAFVMESANAIRFTSGRTNLDDLVAGAVRERVDATIAEFRQQLNDRVLAYLDPQIEVLTAKLDGILEIETSAAELLALARDREAAAAELERLARDSISSVRDRLEAEAQRALDGAKAEAEARAQEAIDRAEAEARQAAEEAAGSAVDTIRNQLPLPPLPGRR